MPRTDAFVAEVAVDLVHALQPAHDQTLQVKLRCHAQVQVQVQGVVVRGERLGRRAAGDVMHHRRLDFQEATGIEPLADGTDDARALDEDLARFRRDDQVDIPLAIALFHIRQSVPLVRQRTQRLGQQAQGLGLDRQFPGAGPGQTALDADDVADVPALEGVVSLAQRIGLQEQLDAAGLVLDLHEAGLAHHPLGHEATGQPDVPARAFQRLDRPQFGIAVLGLQVAGVVVAAEVVGERDALPAQGRQFGAALGDEAVLVGRRRGADLVGHGGRGNSRNGECRSGPWPRCFDAFVWRSIAATGRSYRVTRRPVRRRCVWRRLPGRISGWPRRTRPGRRPAPSGCPNAPRRCAGP